MTKENRPAGWKPDAPTDQRPDPPPAPPKIKGAMEYQGQCMGCGYWFPATRIEPGIYSIPAHGGKNIAGFHPEQQFKSKDIRVVSKINEKHLISDRLMETAQQLTEESKSTDGLAKAIILEAVAKLALASTLLEE